MDIDPRLLEALAKNPNSVASLNEWINKTSDFQQHSEEHIIAKRFYADPNENRRIYHYIKMDNLDSVLKSSSFYLGSINDMNDPMEVKYTYDLAKEILKSLGATASELTVFDQDRKVSFFDTYIWCFSYSDYNQALQNYGDIALGFDTQQIQNSLASKYTKPNFENMQISDGYVFSLKVEYNLDIQKEYITSVMLEWLRAYRGLRYTDTLPIANEIRLQCLKALFLFSLCFKRYKYHQEEEIRFVVIKLTKNNQLQNDFIFRGHPKAIANITSNMLKEIVVTHKNGADERVNTLKQILKQNGFEKVKIRLTDLDY